MGIQFENLKKLDEYAKSLGMTIYEIAYGFMKDGEPSIAIFHDVNMSPERAKIHPEFKGIAQSI